MRTLYTLFVSLYSKIILLASLFNLKAKLWINGRKNWKKKLKASFQNEQQQVIWVHCASLGEFEQGRPLIEALRIERPQSKILLTFFSPSGYEIRKNYSSADWVYYLPSDTIQNAKEFIKIVKPSMAVFVKYEFWFNYLSELSFLKIPTYFISVNIRPDHYFFKWYAKWALNQLKSVTHFFVQNQTSSQLLHSAGIHQNSIAGDTRFDRVSAIAKEAKSIPIIEKFCNNQLVLVAGSTWLQDEKLLAALFLNLQKSSEQNKGQEQIKFIIAPHEIREQRMSEIAIVFSKQKCMRYSQLTNTTDLNLVNVLLIDNIGMLSSLYRYASIAYIGGGFGKGIHNILEAAVFGKPLLFGPNYIKFEEAKMLLQLGGASSIKSELDLTQVVSELLFNQKKYREQCLISQNFVHDNSGALEKILKLI